MYTRDNYAGKAALGVVILGFFAGICAAEIDEKGNVGVAEVSPTPVLALKLAAPSATTGTIVLDFENLPPADIGRLPPDYAGLTWDSFLAGDPKWWDWSSESVDPPFSEPHSGDNYLFNANGKNNLGFSLPNGTDQLLGAWFAKTSGSGGTPNQVRFNGYNSAHSLIEQSSWLALASTPRHLEASFGPVARIEVEHSGPGDATFSMDDLAYQTGETGAAPPPPSDPVPADSAKDVPVDVCLEWSGGPAGPIIVLSDAPALSLEDEQKTRLDLENIIPGPVQSGEALASALSEVLAETEDIVGSALLSNSGTADGVGNFFSLATDVELVNIETRLSIPDPLTLRYFVYESSSQTGTYSKIFEKELTGSGTGLKWYSSGAVSVPLIAGKYYFIGVSWQGVASYYYDFSAPKPVSFGTQLSGSHRSYPPTSTKSYSDNQLAYYQRLTTNPVLEPSPATSWDVYFGTDPEAIELVATDLDQPTYCLGCLQSWTRYYWKIVAKNPNGQKSGPIWSFETVTPVDLNRDGKVDAGDFDLFLEKWLAEVLGP